MVSPSPTITEFHKFKLFAILSDASTFIFDRFYLLYKDIALFKRSKLCNIVSISCFNTKFIGSSRGFLGFGDYLFLGGDGYRFYILGDGDDFYENNGLLFRGLALGDIGCYRGLDTFFTSSYDLLVCSSDGIVTELIFPI